MKVGINVFFKALALPFPQMSFPRKSNRLVS